MNNLKMIIAASALIISAATTTATNAAEVNCVPKSFDYKSANSCFNFCEDVNNKKPIDVIGYSLPHEDRSWKCFGHEGQAPAKFCNQGRDHACCVCYN